MVFSFLNNIYIEPFVVRGLLLSEAIIYLSWVSDSLFILCVIHYYNPKMK